MLTLFPQTVHDIGGDWVGISIEPDEKVSTLRVKKKYTIRSQRSAPVRKVFFHQSIDRDAHQPFSFSRTALLPRDGFVRCPLRILLPSFSHTYPPILHQQRLFSKIFHTSGLLSVERKPTSHTHGLQRKIEPQGQGA
jgi:hypothetical protein